MGNCCSKGNLCLLVPAQSEQRSGQVVVVHCIIRLQLYRLLLLSSCLLIPLKLVVSCSQVTTICRYIAIKVNCPIEGLDAIGEVAQLYECLSFQVMELALFSYSQSGITILQQFMPLFEMKEGISGQEVFFSTFCHLVCDFNYLGVGLCGLQGSDYLEEMFIFDQEQWPSIAELLQLDFH